MAAEIIAYLRVSAKQNGEAGFKLDTQQATVEQYAGRIGIRFGGWYVEIGDSKLADRPQLTRALAHAARTKAPVVMAGLDRMARNVGFLAQVMDSAVDFVVVDNPAANRQTLRVLATEAEAAAKAASERTKAALAAAKIRGIKLGSARPGHWDGHEGARLAGSKLGAIAAAKARTRAAGDAYVDILPLMTSARDEGLSLRAIAAKLNAEGLTTRRGRPWNPMQVARVLARKE